MVAFRRTSRWLHFAIGLPAVLLVCGLADAAHALDKADVTGTPCGLKRYATIPFDISPGGVITLSVTIHGESVPMALHTSGTFNQIDEALAKRLKLSRTSLASGMVKSGGKPVYEYAEPETLQLGPLNFRRPAMLVVTDPANGSRTGHGEPILGTLGLHLFSSVDVEIDFPNQLLSLYSTDHCPGKVVYWSGNYDSVPLEKDDVGQFYFPMELNGAKLETTLATGLGQTVLASEAARKLLNFDETDPEVIAEKSADGTPTGNYRVMELSTTGLAIMNARIRLAPKNKDCDLVTSSNNKQPAYFTSCRNSYPLLLGMNVLRRLHIYIATKEKKLYFTAADPLPVTTAPAPQPGPTATP